VKKPEDFKNVHPFTAGDDLEHAIIPQVRTKCKGEAGSLPNLTLSSQVGASSLFPTPEQRDIKMPAGPAESFPKRRHIVVFKRLLQVCSPAWL
jgi:hypothetical protein